MIKFNMEKLTYRLVSFFSILWFLYLLYTITISFSDLGKMKQINWVEAKNISSIYKGYKATIITRAYQKDNIIIKREYGFFGQGLNIYLSGIDKNKKIADINFFVKEKDYNTSDKNGSKPVSIPYFTLRKIDSPANHFFLWIDIWKFNYSKIIAFSVLFCPLLFVFLYLKLTGNKEFKLKDFDTKSKMVNYIYIMFVLCLLINFIV